MRTFESSGPRSRLLASVARGLIIVAGTLGQIACDAQREPTTPIRAGAIRMSARATSKATITRVGNRLRIRLRERTRLSAGEEVSVRVDGARALEMLRTQLTRISSGSSASSWHAQLTAANGEKRSLTAAQLLALLDAGESPVGSHVSFSLAAPGEGVEPVVRARSEEGADSTYLAGHWGGSTVTNDGSTFAFTSYQGASVSHGITFGSGWMVNGARRTVNVAGGATIYDQSSCYGVTATYPLTTGCPLSTVAYSGGNLFTSFPSVSIGGGCGFDAGMSSTHSFTYVANIFLLSRTDEVTTVGSDSFRRACLPSVETLCDDPTFCETDGVNANATVGDAAVDGQIEFSAPEGSAGNKLVCDVTDWYEWNGSHWVYTDTTVDACWVE